jgi:secreted PhoX family phosphatase
MHMKRREFLEFMGISTVGFAATNLLSSCAHLERSTTATPLPFQPIAASAEDQLLLADGFHYDVLIKWGDRLNASGDLFGTHNDYLAYIPLKTEESQQGLLWVNHEYLDPMLVSGYRKGQERTRTQVLKEQMVVGGSIVHIRKNGETWAPVADSKYNRRLTARTRIPFSQSARIAGSRSAVGTLANCAGGVTPWQTILTCEENYHNFYGEVHFDNGQRQQLASKDEPYGWEKFFPYPAEHYGWVVEVDPLTGTAKKHLALGRYGHESATCVQAGDGRTVVYSGDDRADECLYKFISHKPGSIEYGDLYVANMEKGEWILLSHDQQPELQKHFKDQTDVLIRTREAAHRVGGSPLDRPEDIEVEPRTGDVFVALTMNQKRGNLFGSLLRLEEEHGNPLSLRFQTRTFLAGGEENGFACPDNLAFDNRGNLWMACDVSGKDMNKGPFIPFKNNGLFFIPMSGAHAGQAFQVASAPVNAEFTGPYFSPDGRTLFLSVQHPGEYSPSPDAMISHWPLGNNEMPRSAVVAIQGPALDKIVRG